MKTLIHTVNRYKTGTSTSKCPCIWENLVHKETKWTLNSSFDITVTHSDKTNSPHRHKTQQNTIQTVHYYEYYKRMNYISQAFKTKIITHCPVLSITKIVADGN